MPRISHTILTHLPPEASSFIGLRTLVKVTGLKPDQVKSAIDRLSKRGLAGHAALGVYFRTPAGDAFVAAGAQIKPGIALGGKRGLNTAEARDTLRDRAWGALRQLRKATLPELIELAGKGTEVDATSNLRRYLWKLATYQIVSKLKRRVRGLAPTSNGFIQFVLVRDLGPKAPIWRDATKELIDRNGDKPKVIPLPEVTR